MKFTEKLFGTHSERELKRIYPIVDKIEALRPTMQALTDEELRAKTKEYKDRYNGGESLDSILPEAFATVREAAKRSLGMEHHRVQLMGGIILHQGRIAEMKTGEGKTLVSTLPAYLNALTGRGVHIVTVNDYLANRDAEWMGKVHRFLGLTVGVVLNDMKNDERRQQYACDITYITNNELGFDYLRDNMVIYKEQLVQRELAYCIIDEVDSVLIDEARTPLIISGQSSKSTKLYETADILAHQMQRGEASGEMTKMTAIMGEEIEETGDFIVNEKDKFVTLTDDGVKKVENFFHIENLSDPENLEIQHNVILALRANYLMHRDKDYVVKDDEVLIVDEFTGRIMPGRRYSDGLHQAIEAKEHVKVRRESKTLATITFQNFFNKYEKKAGMTGTALTEEQEFRDIYGMDVIEIPTNRPVIRVDMDDAVYMTKKEKFHAVVEEVKEAHAVNQPVLVGTITIETSELISKMLRREGIPHQVLNAKFHELEAEIVAHAGEAGAVTIATNMAGRGTDIKLDDVAKAAGGLKIIGTERHESRRIDNQLRGRSGRQGDPGSSVFYLSMEDQLLRIFGGDRMRAIADRLKLEEGVAIESKMLTRMIESAQRKVEGRNYDIRKQLLEFDDVQNDQRREIYRLRNEILESSDVSEMIKNLRDGYFTDLFRARVPAETVEEQWDLDGLLGDLKNNWGIDIDMKGMLEASNDTTDEDLLNKLLESAAAIEKAKEDLVGHDAWAGFCRHVLLQVLDTTWRQHITALDALRQGIYLRGYAQKQPKQEYKREAFAMFETLLDTVREGVCRVLMHVQIQLPEEAQQAAQASQEAGESRLADANAQHDEAQGLDFSHVGRNDPCPCGSGKRFKDCHGKLK